jgi:hypothetical protein
MVLSYYLIVEGIRDINGLPLPREGTSEFLQVRCKVDGVPYRMSSSMTSNYDVESKILSRLSSIFAANLSAGNHQLSLQWKRTGTKMKKWVTTIDLALPSYSIIAHADFQSVSFLHELQDTYINHQDTWKPMTKNLTFSIPRESAVTITYSSVVQPQLASFIKDRSMEYVTLRPILDNVAYVDGAQTFGCNPWNPTAATIQGSLRLNLSAGSHTVGLQWRKMGNAFRGWTSSPSFLDGFTTSRNIIVSVDKSVSPVVQDHQRSIIKGNEGSGWISVGNNTIQLSLIKESAVVIRYGLPITQHSNPNLDSNVWEPLRTLRARVVIDGIAYSQIGGTVSTGSRTIRDNTGQLAVVLPSGMHTISLQWQTSPGVSWTLLNEISGGFAHGESLLTFISSEDAKPSITAPLSLRGKKDTAVAINSISVTDIDDLLSSGMLVEVIISVEHGTLHFPNLPMLANDIEFVHLENETRAVFVDTIENINAALLGMEYYPNYLFFGVDCLRIRISDRGNVGYGPPQFDEKNISIYIEFVDYSFTLDVPSYLQLQVMNESSSLHIQPLVLKDVDSFESIFEARLSVTCGDLAVSVAQSIQDPLVYLQGRSGESTIFFSGNFDAVVEALKSVTYSSSVSCTGRIHPEVFRIQVTEVSDSSQTITLHTLIEVIQERVPAHIRTISHPRWTLEGATPFSQLTNAVSTTDAAYNMSFSVFPYQIRENPYSPFVPTATSAMSEIVFFTSSLLSYKLTVQFGSLKSSLIGSNYIVANKSRETMFETSYEIDSAYRESYLIMNGDYFSLVAVDSSRSKWKCSLSALEVPPISISTSWSKLQFISDDGLSLESNFMALFSVQSVEISYAAPTTLIQSARSSIDVSVTNSALIELCLFDSDNIVSPTIKSPSAISCQAPVFSSSTNFSLQLQYAGGYLTESSHSIFQVESNPAIDSVRLVGNKMEGGWIVAISGNWSRAAINSIRWIETKVVEIRLRNTLQFIDGNDVLHFALPFSDMEIKRICQHTMNLSMILELDDFTSPAAELQCAPSLLEMLNVESTVNISSSIVTARVELDSLTVYGTFVSSDINNASCVVDNVLSKPVLLGSNAVSCKLPVESTISHFQLLSGNSMVLFEQDLNRSALPRISSVLPRNVLARRVSTIIISLDRDIDVRNDTELVCAFQQVEIKAVQIDLRTVSCNTPLLGIGNISFALRYNDLLLSISDDSAELRYIEVSNSPFVDNVYPNYGSLSGGEAITLHGRGFTFLESEIVCQFGDAFVVATVVTDDSIVCLSPGRETSATAIIGLVSDTQIAMKGIFTFDFIQVPLLYKASVASSNSSREVTLKGINFRGGLPTFCVFDGFLSSKAMVLSSNVAVCEIPVQISQLSFSIRCAFGHVEDVRFHSNTVDVKTTDSWEIESIFPDVVFAGTEVLFVIRGQTLPKGTVSDTIAVWAGNKKCTDCRIVSETVVQCTCIVSSFANEVQWSVQIQDTSARLVSGLHTAIVVPPAVVDIHPKVSYLMGGNVAYVTGSGFSMLSGMASSIFCNFTQNHLSAATIFNDTTLGCIIAPSTTAEMGSLGLLLQSGVQFDTAVPFRYVRAPTLWSVDNSIISATYNKQIIVFGSEFDNSLQYRCHFGDFSTTEGVVIDTSKLKCVSPLFDQEGEILFGVSVIGSSSVVGALPIRFVSSSMVRKVSSSSVSREGGVSVRIEGVFFEHSVFTCLFNTTPSSGVWVDYNTLMCTTPIFASYANFVKFGLLENDHELHIDDEVSHILITQSSWNSIAENLSIRPLESALPVVTGVNTVVIDGRGGTIIRINFEEDLQYTAGYQCSFVSKNEIVVVANQSGARQLICQSPALDTSSCVLKIVESSSQQQIESLSMRVLQHDAVASVYPSVYLLGSDRNVTVRGNGFSESRRLSCVFNNIVIPARVFSDNMLTCKVPPIAGNFDIGVSFDGTWVFPMDQLSVEVLHRPTFTELTPSVIPLDRNDRVFISGHHFASFATLNDVQCKFGDVLSPVEIADDNNLSCVFEPSLLEIGGVTVSFTSVLGGDLQTSLKVTVSNSIRVFAAIPSTISRSVTSVLILMKGSNFVVSSDLLCFVNNVTAPAIVMDSNTITCLFSSPSWIAGKAVFGVSLGNSYKVLASDFIVVTDQCNVHSAQPLQSSVLGGEQIHITGEGFSAEMKYSCEFGHEMVNAIVVSSTELICVSPVHADGFSHLRVLAGTNEVYTADNFLYRALNTIESAFPSAAYVSSVVNMTISFEQDFLLEDYLCNFNGTTFVGTTISNRRVVCTIHFPSVPETTSLYLVSMHGLRVTNLLPIRVLSPIVVEDVQTKVVAVTNASQVALRGQNFPLGMFATCSFDDDHTVGVVLSSNILVCAVPSSVMPPSKVVLTVHFSGLRAIMAPIPVEFIVPPRMEVLRSSKLTATEFMEWVIGGSGLQQDGYETTCTISEATVLATRLEGNDISCRFPSEYVCSSLLQVSVGGVKATIGESFILPCENLPTVSTAFPTVVVENSGTQFSLEGANFNGLDELKCAVGNVFASVVLLSDSSATCNLTLPLCSEFSDRQLRVLIGNKVLLSKTLDCSLQVDDVAFIQPSVVTEKLETLLSISGHFQQTQSYVCVVDGVVFDSAILANFNLLHCLLPSAFGTGNYTVSVETVEGSRVGSAVLQVVKKPNVLQTEVYTIDSRMYLRMETDGDLSFISKDGWYCDVGGALLTGMIISRQQQSLSFAVICDVSTYTQYICSELSFAVSIVSRYGLISSALSVANATNLCTSEISAKTIGWNPEPLLANSSYLALYTQSLTKRFDQTLDISVFQATPQQNASFSSYKQKITNNVHIGWHEMNLPVANDLVMNSSRYVPMSPNISNNLGNVFQMESFIQTQHLHISNVRPIVIDSVNGTWVEVFGSNFVSHTVCSIGNNTQIPTMYLSTTLVRCFVPPPGLFQPLSVVTLEVKNTLSVGKSSTHFTLWYDVAYDSIFHMKNLTSLAAESLETIDSTVTKHNPSSIVCLLKGGCNFVVNEEFTTGKSSRAVDVIFRSDRKEPETVDTNASAASITFSSSIFSMEPSEISLPCENCFFQIIGSSLLEVSPLCLNVQNETFSCYNSIEKEDSEVYCSVPRMIHPGARNVTLLAKCSSPFMWKTVNFDLDENVNKKWKLGTAANVNHIFPRIQSIFPTFGWARFESVFEIAGFDLDIVASVAFVSHGEMSTQVPVEFERRMDRLLVRSSLDMLPGEYSIVLISSYRDMEELSQSIVLFEEPRILSASTSEDASTLVNVFGFGFEVYSQVLCRITYGNGSNSIAQGKIFSGHFVQCKKDDVTLLGAKFALSFNGIDFTDNVPFVDISYSRSIEEKLQGKQDSVLVEDHREPKGSISRMNSALTLAFSDPVIVTLSCSQSNFLPMRLLQQHSSYVNFSCILDDNYLGESSYHSQKSAICKLPPLRPATYMVQVLDESGQVAAVDTKVICTPEPKVSSISIAPKFDNIRTTFVIRGVYFSEFMDMRCSVGLLAGEISIPSQHKLLCSLSYLHIQNFSAASSFAVKVGDHAIFSSPFCLSPKLLSSGGELPLPNSDGTCPEETKATNLAEEPLSARDYNFSIRSIFPRSGLTSGNTVVRLGVIGVAVATNVRCIFDGIPVAAFVADEERIVCRTPSHLPGIVSVSVVSGDDRVHWCCESFTFYPPIMIVHWEPTRLNGYVQSVVEFRVTNLMRDIPLYCHVNGQQIVSAMVLNSTHVVCRVPVLYSSTANISIGSFDEEWSNRVSLHVDHTDALLSITPSFGSVSGSTLVSIIIPEELDIQVPYCEFGSFGRVAGVLQDNEVHCISPPSHSVAVVDLFIVDGSGSEDPKFYAGAYKYLYAATLHRVDPESYVIGLPLDLHIFGANFMDSTFLFCLVNGYELPSVWMSPSMLTCQVPASLLSGNPMQATVQVSNNGVDISDSLFISSRVRYEIKGVHPVQGFTVGGSNVFIQFDASVADETFVCVFDGLKSQAILISGADVVCEAPMHLAGVVNVDVVTHTMRTVGSFQFEYVTVPSLRVSDNSLFISNTSSSAEFYGDNLPANLTGRFRSIDGRVVHHGDCYAQNEITFACSNVVTDISSGFLVLEVSIDGASFVSNAASVQVFSPVSIVWMDPLTVLNNGMDDLRFAARFEGSQLPILHCEYASTEKGVIQRVQATIFGKDRNLVCAVPALNTIEENLFSVFQHNYRIFGPSFLTVVPGAVLDFIDRSSLYIGLHETIQIQFTDPVYPYPAPAVEFQGKVYPITILSPFRGVATVQSYQLGEKEMLYLTYPTQSNRKLPLVNLSVVDFAHDLQFEKKPVVVQSPTNVSVKSLSCSLQRELRCQVTEGEVETVFIDACQLECSIFVPFMSSTTTVLRVCRDDDCVVPLHVQDISILPTVSVIQTVPSFGTVLGNTPIRILGSGFSQHTSLECVFGMIAVPAFLQSDNELSCTLPQAEPGTVSVNIQRQGAIVSNSIAEFTFIPKIEINNVTPTVISSEGGTLVYISLHKYLNASMLHYCRFNDVYVRMVVMNNSTGVCEAPAFSVDKVDLAVAASFYNDLSHSVSIQVQHPLHPIFLDPTVFVAGVEGIINVYFESRIPDDFDIECRFDDFAVSFDIFKDYISCKYNALETGVHTLSLVSNGVKFYEVEVESRLPYRIMSVWPQYAFTHKSTAMEIELSGNQYLESAASCCFGQFKVPASILGYNRWQCFSPTIPDDGLNRTWVLPVGMAFGENFCDFSTLEVTLIHKLEFSSTSYQQGLIYGGDSVVLPMLQGNDALEVVYCRIGTQISPGQYTPGRGIICITPQSPRGLYEVEISVNGVDFQLSGTSFEFLLPRSSSYLQPAANGSSRIDAALIPVIYSLSMDSFPATGQFNVFLTGVNYNYDSVCKLESGAVLETVYFSPTMIQCFMPVRPAGSDKLIVENRDTGISSVGKDITFVTSPTVSSYFGVVVTPAVGPRNRPTILTVSVPGLNGATGYSCLIGEQWVPSFNVTNSTLSCIAPPNSYVGQVKVQVGNSDPVLLEGFGIFEYVDDPIAYDVQPKAAVFGSTLLIFGRGFLRFPSMSIVIGSTESNCSIINDGKLICTVPDIAANDYQLFLTTNGQHLVQTGLEYRQIEAIRLDHLWPFNGPALKGQTILSIYGSGFPETIDVYCLIDTAMVPATVLSPSLVQCRIPPHTPAIVKVSLLADGVPLHPRAQSLDFAYVPDVSVVRITPDFGYTAGSFPILLFGSNFLNTSSLGCMFADMKTRGIFLSNTSLVCLLPSTLGRPELADLSNIPVEVTLNGYDYSDSKRTFAYSQPCDRGFFCPGLTRQLCPNGTYCPENSRNFTLCPPGTFQPMQGQTGCVLCAVGYLCPDQGMSRPLQCPNGLICDSMGLSATSKLCPAGSYCLNTTKSSSSDDFIGLPEWVLNNITGSVYFNENLFDYSYSTWPAPAVGQSRPQAPPESSCDGLVCQGGSGQILAESPFPCPIGHYCRAGAGTQIPIPKNFSSPQRCYDGFFCPRGSYNPEGAGPCPNGYFCPTQLYAIICPAGTYCPGVGNTAPVECYPGTYNPFEGQANCTVCPAGYICPGWGLLLPEPCPAGFVCTSLGLSYPVVLCPAGYYCEEGTITLDPSDPTNLRPKICREGQFCLGGVASNINIEWINTQPWGSTHPQTCAEGTYCQAGAYLSSGSGLCFQGHYCPPNTSFPIQTPLGNFASGFGSVAPTLCYPGTYAPLEAQVNCDKCPSGHTCTSYGTYIPAICAKGTYRSQVDSLTCVNCPVGTYSYETGAPDISMCLPCPQGAVCPIVQMTSFVQSGTCPNGYVCGAGTQLSNQFTHFSPAGYSTNYSTKPEDMYDEPCDSGFYCSRGTPLNQNTASKCTVGAFCPQATPVSPSRETLCPEYTTSPTATTQVTSCVIYPTPVCRKELVLETDPLESIYYYSSFSYDMLDDSASTVELDSSLTVSSPTGEVQVVEVIHPLNTTSSTPPWFNDTIEAFRACPTYGSGAGGNYITIIGRNFKDTELNYCKFRACLSANLGQHLRRCKNQVNAPTGESLPIVGNISAATYITKARYISPTRMECTTPKFLFNDDDHFHPSFAVNKYECMYLDAFGNNATKGNGNFSYVRPCDTVPGTVCPNLPMTGYEFFSKLVFPCTTTESFLGICGDTPIIGYMMNPCMSGEVAVEVTNDGEHYTGGDDLSGKFLISTVRYYDQDTIYDKFKNYSINATLAVYTMVMPEYYYTNPDILAMETAHCSLPRYLEESSRPREQDIYLLKAMEVALVRIDLSFLPDFMVYGQHYVISIYVRPSRCDSNFCNSAGVQLPPEEFVPCQSPISYSNWFNQKDIPKNVVNNITIFALDDLLFQVQIHIPYGLFAAYRPLFYNTTSINVHSPSRAKSIVGLDKSGVATRELTPYVSYVRQSVPMQYFFCAVVTQEDSTSVYQPLNLPPRYSDFAEGRALIMNNVSVGNPKVPLVLDNYDDINFSVDFWMMPATTPSESKEQLDAYFETFHETTYDETTGYTFDFQTLVLPYFPYFSNCYGFDSYIPIWYVTENPDLCSLPDIYDKAWPRYRFDPLPTQDQIRFVGPFDIFTDPIADWCQVTLQCNYEEQLTTTEATPRWFELESSDTLFKLIRTPIDYFQYTGRQNITLSRHDGGGGAYVQELTAITTDNFIPVMIVRTTASTGCTLQCFPRVFKLEIQYYQVDAHNKRIIAATLQESSFDRNTERTDYELTINFRPLGFIDLILAFAFDTSIFVVLFILIGFMTVFVAFIGWLITRLTTLLQNPPQLRMTGMLALIVPPPLAGVTMAVILIWLMTALANNFIYGTFVTDPNSPVQTAATQQYIDQYPLLYNNLLTGTLTEDQILSARLGRIGTAFMMIAFCCFAVAATMYFPKEETKRELEVAQKRTPLAKKSELWQPILWKKLNFIFASFILGTILVCAIYLSYWTDYGTYFYQVFVMYLLVGQLVEYIAQRQLQDEILIAPLKCAYGFQAGLISFGSPNFLDFILSNYVEFAITSFQRVIQKFYLDGLGNIVSEISERMMQLIIRFTPKYLQGYSFFRKTEEAEKDYRNRAVEGIALQDEENESVEPILEYFADVSCDTVITYYSPFVVYLLMQYRIPIYIPVAYGIRQSDMVIYMVYQLFLIIFQPFVDIFNHSQNELFYGWKIYEYLVYSRYRFLQRETRWKGMENSLDECIEEGLRRMDQMCFSSQFFMMTTIQFNGIVYVMLAYQIWIQNKYSPFSDPAVFFLGGYIFALFLLLRHGVLWLAIQLKVWRIKHENTAWHIVQEEEDDLDIPAWEEIKGASTEAFLLNQRITSETFRYKFLNYNRTWLINQLPQILTPRTLRRSRPYLINQFERIINAKRDDISDDSEAEEKKFGPVALTTPSRNIIRWWLGRARRRMRLRNFVEPLIKRARGAQCEQCLSRKQLQVEYEVDLDTMSGMYDRTYPGDEEVDQVQWKTFWTNNQRYHTLCLACITKRKEVEAKKALAAGGYDPLYDDDEQEAYPEWGPVFLSAASKAIMLNWYKKAQKLRAGKRKQRARKDKIVKDISDDEGDEPAFSWLKEGLKDITPASKAIAIKWMRTARARLQQKRGKGAGLREKDLAPDEGHALGEGFRSGNKSKMLRK